ncbi:helix-turn-helix domain-containing protein [Xanthobacter autotrophicus]|uniref:helix-turn-helix domain-containing protein n=1 Tax=Xanthobacter autotrophicus TaxID=280 RepID=UPI00372D2C3B
MSLTAETLYNDGPLVPKQVAERWGCSERHVRNLIRSGHLGHFRLGGRLLRIPASAVEEYERCQIQNSSLDGSRTDGSSHGGKTAR